MKHIVLTASLGFFVVGCASVKEQVSEKSTDNQKVLLNCSEKRMESMKDMECIDAAKIEGGKVNEMMK